MFFKILKHKKACKIIAKISWNNLDLLSSPPKKCGKYNNDQINYVSFVFPKI